MFVITLAYKLQVNFPIETYFIFHIEDIFLFSLSLLLLFTLRGGVSKLVTNGSKTAVMDVIGY
jgi:hypothetical protein